MKMLLALALFACTGTPDDSATPGGEEGSEGGDDTSIEEGDTTCADVLGLPVVAFDPTGPSALQRWEPAGDFSVPLRDGSTWTLSENWTGCETYLFLPHDIPLSQIDGETWWYKRITLLPERAPNNAHFFFVYRGRDAEEAETYYAAIEDELDTVLGRLDEEEAAWWRAHLHVLGAPSRDLEDDTVRGMLTADVGAFGFGIDRNQRLRGLGSPSSVEAYSTAAASAGAWPYEARIFMAGYEARYWNFEAERQAKMEAVDADVVEVFGGDVIAEYEDGVLSLPDATTMASYDTLEIDVQMECPDPDGQEQGNCGAWDYLAYMWLWDEPSESWLEMGRFITTYHRESRWVLDGSHALGWLQEGGERKVRYEWAPSWNTQPTAVTLSVRLSNQGKGTAAREVLPLFQGGGFSSTYNDDRPPVEVEIPADAVKVELVSIATGHGMETGNCAEFCDHGHHFTIGSETWSQEFTAPGDDTGCQEAVDQGVVPNQSGTWWYGRGGWCPGARVDPFVADVTAQVSPGSTATVSYEATVGSRAPADGEGTAVLRSWLVISR